MLFVPDQEGYSTSYGLQRDYFHIPLGFFLKAEKKTESKNASTTHIDVYSKDGRSFRFKFSSREVDRIFQVLQAYSSVERKEDHFAFEYFKHAKALEEQYRGWKIYSIAKEFERQGLQAEPIGQDDMTATSPTDNVLLMHLEPKLTYA